MRRVGDVLAREHGWGAERLALELERFAEEADAEGILAETVLAEDADARPSAATP